MQGLVKERKRKRQPERMSAEKEERHGSLVEDQQAQPQTRRRPPPTPLQANASVIPHPCAPARHTKGHFLPLSLAKAPDPI